MKCTYMTDILFEALDEIIDTGVLNGKKIVFFGLNAPAFLCKQYLQDKNFNIFAFVDNYRRAIETFNNPNIKPTFHHLIGEKRIQAYLPYELPEEGKGEYVFLLYSKYESQMIEQLKQLGYDIDSQVFVVGGFWRTEEIKKKYVPENAGRELSDDEIKELQLEGLRYIHNLCEENGLKYYIHYGTLLGAVRHGGYIPWDDDIDILMSNSDMLKLIDIIKKEDGRYGIYYSAFNDPCRHFICKIEDRETVYHQWDIPIEIEGGHVALDIFPMGGMPGGEEDALAYFNEILEIGLEYDDLTVEFPNPDEAHRQRRLECRQQVLDALNKYSFEESEYVFTIPTKPGRPLMFPRKFWDERILIDFEGEKFYAPKDYDGILSLHYGDYMTPPDENHRVSIHRNKVFERKA